MTEMIEPPLESSSVQLTSQTRLSFDRYNKTLSYKYRKRNGKGRNADYSNEYGYGNSKAEIQRNLNLTKYMVNKYISEVSEIMGGEDYF